jgi:hypothetical protein
MRQHGPHLTRAGSLIEKLGVKIRNDVIDKSLSPPQILNVYPNISGYCENVWAMVLLKERIRSYSKNRVFFTGAGIFCWLFHGACL